MKKTMFTILWMLAFFIVGFIIFSVFTLVMAHTFHTQDQASLDDWKVRLIMLVDRLGPIGLPVLALILGIIGKLPGTQSQKDLVSA